jgi:catecholate siderophore receptor
MSVRFAPAILFGLVLSAPALAADLAAGDGLDADQSGAIVVTGERGDDSATRTATRTDSEVKDIPQSLSLVSESDIDDRDLRSIAEVLRYVPGTTPGTGEGNRDQITLRGNNTTADFFVDGVRDDVQYFRDLYNAARIEVLRGPNAMIFGRGGGGGVVNRVTKRSSLDQAREIALQGDSESGVRLTADLDQPLGGGAGLRLNGVYENGESFRRGVELERYAVNPTAGVMLGGDTRLDLSYEYLHDRRTADRGVPAFGDRPLDGADRLFFGDPRDSFARADVHLATLAIEHGFGEGLTLRNRSQFGHYDKFYQNVFPADLIEATGQVQLSAYNDSTRRTNSFSQTDLVWDASFGGVDQTLLAGFEIGRQEGRNRRRNGFFQPADSASLLVPGGAPTMDAILIFRPVNTNAARSPAAFNESEASVAALYIQDQIRPSDRVEIVAGLRLDRFTLEVENLNTGQTFRRTDNLVSPRLGLILKPTPDLSVYASYSRSYLPSGGDQFSSLDLTSEALKPERFDNYEIGAKWQPRPGLLATAALYRLDRSNTRAPGPTPGSVVLTGAQRSRGLELSLQGEIGERWQIAGGYAFQKADIRRTTAAAPAGREVPLVPRHQFSLWNRYDAGERIAFGLGVIAATKSFASISNAVTLPGYVRLDAALFYALADGLEAQLNVENLFGNDYFPTAHNDNNIAPGAPTTARATLRFRF